MKKFGLIGKNIQYSLSPLIHQYLLKYFNVMGNYELIDINDIQSITKESLFKYDGLNITIPYKVDIANYVDDFVGDSEELQIINTIKMGKSLIGYNTDILGFDKFYKQHIKSVKNIGVLGNSATAKMLKYYFKKFHNIDIKIFSSKENNQTILYENILNYKVDFLINTTPLGQGLYHNKSIVDKNTLKQLNLKYVLDFNYNPYNTLLLKDSKALGYKTFNGLEILINQAIYSFEIWNEIEADEEVFKLTKAYIQRKEIDNFLVYGMPLCGKTTLYNEFKEQQKICNEYCLYDLDTYIEQKHLKEYEIYPPTISNFVNQYSIEHFRGVEYKALSELLVIPGKKIIFLGGGTLTNSHIFDLLEGSMLLYYDIPKKELLKRLNSQSLVNRPLLASSNYNTVIKKYNNLYSQRIGLYNSVYDYSFANKEEFIKLLT